MAPTRPGLKMVSFRLTAEVRSLLLELGRYHGQPQTAVLERLVRDHGRELGLFPAPSSPASLAPVAEGAGA